MFNFEAVRPLGGILGATVTPFAADGSVDEAAFGSYIDWLAGQGVSAAIVHADSGEGHSLTPVERERVTRIASEAAAGRIRIVAGLIAQSTAEAVALGKADQEAGADALMIFPPTSFLGQPLPSAVPVNYHRAIIDGSGLPLVAFQLQSELGGVEYRQEVLHEILSLDGVIAIKESTFDAYRFRTTMDFVRREHPNTSLLSGNDNFIYESLLLGADGALIGFGTVACQEQVAMFEAIQRQDYARAAELARQIEPLVHAVFAPPLRDYRARLKHILTLQGVLHGTDVRPPLLDISDEDKNAVRTALAASGLLPEGA